MQVGELRDVQSAKKDKRKNCGRDEWIVYTALMEIGLYYWIYVYIVNKDMRIYTFLILAALYHYWRYSGLCTL